MKRSPHIHVRQPIDLRWSWSVVTSPANSSPAALALAPWAAGVGEDEDLVHADVEGFGLAGRGQLVDEGEEHLVDPRVERAVAAAVDVLVMRILAGRSVRTPGCLTRRAPVFAAQDGGRGS